MIIISFQSQLLVLHLVKYWLTNVNFVLMVVSKYLTIVNQCLTIFPFFENSVSLKRSPLDEAKKSMKPFKK